MRRLVLGIAVAVTSLMPTFGMADDQQIADYIKTRLQAEQQAGNLKGFNVDMRVENGTVLFKGHVSNTAQEMTILKTAQAAGHLGVVKVVDDINILSTSATTVAQPTYAQPLPTQVPARQVSATLGTGASNGIVVSGDPMPFASSGAPQQMSAAPAMQASYPGSVGPATEAPNLPGYAWPGYAAHPNYGALSYPQQYSASAWPYIGPFYPYPQVPLGWRKVSLEWDDGWWMLDFHDK
ncbi:MAG: BON domain-containing protein [Planctomycetota bacterium]